MKLINSVPTSFILGADTYPIILDRNKMANSDLLGLLDRVNKRIYYTDISRGCPISISEQVDTFYHERTHALLDLCGVPKLSNNEEFVNLFSNLLRQTDNSLKFK